MSTPECTQYAIPGHTYKKRISQVEVYPQSRNQLLLLNKYVVMICRIPLHFQLSNDTCPWQSEYDQTLLPGG